MNKIGCSISGFGHGFTNFVSNTEFEIYRDEIRLLNEKKWKEIFVFDLQLLPPETYPIYMCSRIPVQQDVFFSFNKLIKIKDATGRIAHINFMIITKNVSIKPDIVLSMLSRLENSFSIAIVNDRVESQIVEEKSKDILDEFGHEVQSHSHLLMNVNTRDFSNLHIRNSILLDNEVSIEKFFTVNYNSKDYNDVFQFIVIDLASNRLNLPPSFIHYKDYIRNHSEVEVSQSSFIKKATKRIGDALSLSKTPANYDNDKKVLPTTSLRKEDYTDLKNSVEHLKKLLKEKEKLQLQKLNELISAINTVNLRDANSETHYHDVEIRSRDNVIVLLLLFIIGLLFFIIIECNVI